MPIKTGKMSGDYMRESDQVCTIMLFFLNSLFRAGSSDSILGGPL